MPKAVSTKSEMRAGRPTKIGRPSAAESQRKTEKLLRTAATIFAQKGYAQTSLDSVAAAAGLSKKTIYTWYGDKAGLFDSVMYHLLESLKPPGADSGRQFGKDGLAELETQVAHIIAATLQPAFLGIYRIFAREAEKSSDVLKTFHESTATRSHAAIMNVLLHHPDFQMLRVPAEEAARAILEVLHSNVVLMSLQIVSPEAVSPEDEARRIVGIVMNGCLER